MNETTHNSVCAFVPASSAQDRISIKLTGKWPYQTIVCISVLRMILDPLGRFTPCSSSAERIAMAAKAQKMPSAKTVPMHGLAAIWN